MTANEPTHNVSIDGYAYDDADLNCSHEYLVPALDQLLSRYHTDKSRPIFDLGCGNGSIMHHLDSNGYTSLGVDPSTEGIEQAKELLGAERVAVGSAYDDLREKFGTFHTVVSLEVVEHVYAPRDYAKSISDLLVPGGHAILSTPYHGYWKNLAMALSGTLDRHFTALWDHGHIKFWSIDTLTQLMQEADFVRSDVMRVGRIPPLAKSMVLVFQKK